MQLTAISCAAREAKRDQGHEPGVGLTGLAVMGQNLAVNMAEHGFKVGDV